MDNKININKLLKLKNLITVNILNQLAKLN